MTAEDWVETSPFAGQDADQRAPAVIVEGDHFMRLAEAVQHYLRARRPELTAKSRTGMRGELQLAARTIGPDMLVRALRRSHVERWLTDMTKPGRAVQPSTIRLRLSIFRGFCRWCVLHGYMKTDPTIGLRGPRHASPIPRELTDDEIRRLLTVLPDARAEVIVMLGLVQGLRRASIAEQLRDDIDLPGAMMLVTHSKGGKQRWLPLLPDTRDAIDAYYREVPGASGPLIRSERYPALGLHADHIGRLVSGWMRDAGIKTHAYDGKASHALRHTRAGTMLDDGADIRAVSEALGHASLTPTMVYLRRRHANSMLREAMGGRRYREVS